MQIFEYLATSILTDNGINPSTVHKMNLKAGPLTHQVGSFTTQHDDGTNFLAKFWCEDLFLASITKTDKLQTNQVKAQSQEDL